MSGSALPPVVMKSSKIKEKSKKRYKTVAKNRG
jgi:hypothetical protein